MTHQEFKVLYEQHRERLLNRMTVVVRNRETAEDVAAVAFAAAFERLDTYRGEASFYTWLCAIAMNRARRLMGRDRSVSLDALTKTEAQEPTVFDTLDRRGCCEDLQKAMRCVPPLHRRTLMDRFVRGYSVKSIARRNQIPVGTVLSRIFKAKKLLRKAWRHFENRSHGRLKP